MDSGLTVRATEKPMRCGLLIGLYLEGGLVYYVYGLAKSPQA
jgi:hypothetical protein